MGILTIIISFILIFSFFVFVTFFGRLPAFRNTPIAWLHRFITSQIPNAIYAIDRRVSGGRISASLSRFGNYILHDRHPTVVIIFLIIILTGEYLYLPAVWPSISPFTRITALISASLPLLFFYLSCAADPGYITPSTHRYHMALYPYDHALFHPNVICRTCNHLKPPRSKHCSICKKCVARSDHHCIFINSCVGYGNHRWFLLLLLTTAIMTSYGSLMGLNVLASHLHAKHPKWPTWPSKEYGYTRYFTIWAYGFRREIELGSTTLLALLTSPLVWGLTIYTFYQVYSGVTTNESLKWTELKEDMEDGYAYRRNLSRSRARDLHTEPECERWPVEPEMVIRSTLDAQPPKREGLAGEGEWEHVRSLKSVENLYDMGFWDNLMDIFVPNYAFGNGQKEPAAERRRKKR